MGETLGRVKNPDSACAGSAEKILGHKHLPSLASPLWENWVGPNSGPKDVLGPLLWELLHPFLLSQCLDLYPGPQARLGGHRMIGFSKGKAVDTVVREKAIDPQALGQRAPLPRLPCRGFTTVPSRLPRGGCQADGSSRSGGRTEKPAREPDENLPWRD